MGESLSIESMKATDVLGCVGTVIVLLLASMWIPLLGPFLSLLAPLPFLYYASKWGLYQGAKIFTVTVLILGLIGKLTGFPQAVYLCVEFGLLGLIISETYRRKYSFGLAVFCGTGLMLLLGAIILIITGLSQDLGPIELVLEYFKSNLDETIRVYEKMGSDPEQVTLFREFSEMLMAVIAKTYPSLAIVGTGFVVWLNIVLSRPLFRVMNLRYPFDKMDRWSSPEHMVWGVIATGFFLLLLDGTLEMVALNGLVVMIVIYVFHGLSIVLFYLNKYHVPGWLRFGVYFLLLFQQVFLCVLALAGLFDQWFNFRKMDKQNMA
ncbi:MAG: YybS family protein [Deltaproteobacteria bacterium]|nr:YybS family protein [Deltaproteobacteria bacterium]